MGILKQAINVKMSVESRHYSPSHGMTSMFNHYKSEEYASAYPNIRAIAAEYMQVKPFAINANGEPIQNNNIINALYNPNQSDSSVSFFEKIAVSTLFHRKTYILVWRRDGNETKPGGDLGFKGKNIAGFTFIEYPGVTRRDGRTFYNIGAQEFSDKEVIVLPGGVDPNNLYAGYSPSEASRRWAKLDDYIADFQSGFFENGAVPAGVINVVAATPKEYDDIVDTILARHQGAGKNGKVTFSHIPLDQTGKPAQAQITWTPFGQSNKDMDFQSMYNQVDKRLSASYGVADIIKGIDSNAKYDNGGFSEKTFSKRAVYPLLLRNYTQFNHELNRITNGTGIAIAFKYDIPSLADEEKVKAETKTLDFKLINDAITAGYTLDSVIDAFELSNGYKLLKTGQDTKTEIENDKPDVDEGGETEQSPNPAKIDGVTPVNNVQVILADTIIEPEMKLIDEDKLAKATRNYMQTQVDRVVKEYQDEPTNAVEPVATETELQTFIEAMLVVISEIMLINGSEMYLANAEEVAGLILTDLQGFNLTEEAVDSYRAYLRRVGISYGEDTAKSIRKVLADSKDLGYTKSATEKALKDIMYTDDYRVKRLARTELNTSQAMGGYEGMKELAAETGTEWEKALDHSNSPKIPCEFCLTYDGKWFDLKTPLLALGESVEGVDGSIFVNDFVQYDAGDIHANGRGATIYRRKA